MPITAHPVIIFYDPIGKPTGKPALAAPPTVAIFGGRPSATDQSHLKMCGRSKQWPLLALSGHFTHTPECPLLEVKGTSTPSRRSHFMGSASFALS